VQSASKEPIVGSAALALLDGVTDLYVAKGKKVLHLDLTAERPSDDELLGLLLGRSGKLRAPAIRAGTRFVVGYNPKIFETTLG
jgi:arsenate reductase-like glutaredoxin family protein